VERPGKAATVTVCDVLEGPIVRLKDGSVMQFYNEEQARQHLTQVDSVLFLGDILFNYGDFSENGQMLVPAGYCSEWWALEVETKLKERHQDNTFEKGARQLQIEKERLKSLLEDYFYTYPTFEEAVNISKELNIPFHPYYTFYWKLISSNSFLTFFNWLKEGKIKRDLKGVSKIILPYSEKNILYSEGKKVLDEAGIAHLIVNKDNLVIQEKEAKCLALHLNIFTQEQLLNVSFDGRGEGQTALDIINEVSSVVLRDKAGTFIGARMGRPEKAKMREMTGSPQVMFPVGEEGDRLRSFQSAMGAGKIKSVFPLFYCTSCSTETIYSKCERCGKESIKKYHCRVCGNLETDTCRHGKAVPYKNQEIDINHYFSSAKELVGMKTHPDLIKGIRGTSNKNHIVEHLAKGLLRAKHNIYVNKEGTTRYDCTELPLTHFKPKEVKTSVAKLKALGYIVDIYGKELVDDNQILELKVQDVILPGFGSIEESSPQVLSRVANFIDDLLVNFYKLESYYNIKK
jgi:DNA polymerase II large subunit